LTDLRFEWAVAFEGDAIVILIQSQWAIFAAFE
jgi:hypothetical protein